MRLWLYVLRDKNLFIGDCFKSLCKLNNVSHWAREDSSALGLSPDVALVWEARQTGISVAYLHTIWSWHNEEILRFCLVVQEARQSYHTTATKSQKSVRWFVCVDNNSFQHAVHVYCHHTLTSQAYKQCLTFPMKSSVSLLKARCHRASSSHGDGRKRREGQDSSSREIRMKVGRMHKISYLSDPILNGTLLSKILYLICAPCNGKRNKAQYVNC